MAAIASPWSFPYLGPRDSSPMSILKKKLIAGPTKRVPKKTSWMGMKAKSMKTKVKPMKPLMKKRNVDKDNAKFLSIQTGQIWRPQLRKESNPPRASSEEKHKDKIIK
jgi:hypothetical protein